MTKKATIEELLTAVQTGSMAYITVSSTDSKFELMLEDIHSKDIDYVKASNWIALKNVSCLIPVTNDITLTAIKDFDGKEMTIYTIRDGSIKVAFAVR